MKALPMRFFSRLALAAAVILPSLGFAQAATVSTTDLTVSGLNATTGLQTAPSPTYFSNDGKTILVIKGGGTAVTATIVTQATSISQQGYGTVTLSNQTVSIPSASIVIAGPWPVGRWNNVSDTVQVNFSSITGVSTTAVRLPQ